MADLSDSWRTANQVATAAVRTYFGKAILAMAGKAGYPSDSEAQEVIRLQDTADDLFLLANHFGTHASNQFPRFEGDHPW